MHSPMDNKYDYPKHFARFYDTIYMEIRDSADKDFFLNNISEAQGKVLEVGVGTGRFFKTALIEGADIYGIDTSPDMLDVLYDKIATEDHHRISRQSVVDFKFDFKFNLIIAPFRVMMHVMEIEDQIKAINNVYDHLEAGGTFIFDAFVPDLKYIIKGFENFVDFEGEYEEGKKLKRIVSSYPDLINQIIKAEFILEWEDENDQVQNEKWTVPLRFFFRYELEHLMERTKFESYNILGDYKGRPLNEKSKEFIVVCKKSK
jgi:SAM-dependent methyltransferase